MLIPIFGLQFLLLPVRPSKGSSMEYLYQAGWSPLIGRGLSRLCSDWLDLDVYVELTLVLL